MSREPNPKRGAILVFVMVCILVVVGVVAGAMRDTLAQLKEKRLWSQRRQTELLLEAGVEKVVGQLKQDPTRAPGIWDVSGAFGEFDTAEVRAEVLETTDQSVLLKVTARMQQGASHFHATQISQKLTVQISSVELSEENEDE